MRQIETHKVNAANEDIELTVLDEPAQSGACGEYQVRFRQKDGEFNVSTIKFHKGVVAMTGLTGLTHEVLLAILTDRLAHFQNGPYANVGTEDALQYLIAAQGCLQSRTRERLIRGVEGTHLV